MFYFQFVSLVYCLWYTQIQVVSGTSGGSICAAMCACKTEAELKEEVLVDVISTDYRRNGVMAAEKIVWFPSLWTQAVNFVSTGFLIDNREYCRTCQYYYGEITFAEVLRRKADYNYYYCMICDTYVYISDYLISILINVDAHVRHMNSPSDTCVYL